VTDILASFPLYNHASRVEILAPSGGGGWLTRVDFHRSENQVLETVEFESSSKLLTHYDLLMEFDFIEIIDRNQGGNQLEFGRYELRIYVDGECTKCDVDSLRNVSANEA